MKKYTKKEHQKVMKLRKNGLGRYEIARITGIPLGTVGLWLRGTKPEKCLNKSRETLIKNLQIAHSKLQQLRNNKLTELSNKVNSDFTYVLGALLGDGYIYFNPNGGGHVRISVRDKEFAEKFYNSIKNWCGLNCRMYQYRGFWRVYSSSVITARVLKNFDLNELKHMNEEIVSTFLKGIYDAEGNINQKYIRFYNSDATLIKLVKELLEIIGIKSITVTKRDKEIHKIREKSFLVKPVFTLGFGRKSNLELFHKKVGFSIKRKQEKLENVLKHYQRNPLPWTREEIEVLKNNSNRDYHKIAEIMGRSSSSVRKALYRYNLKPNIDNRLLS